MAIERLDILDTKKKKKKLIQPRVTEQGQKLFGTQGVNAPVPTLSVPALGKTQANKLTPQIAPQLTPQTISPVESANAKFGRERFEAEQAFAAKNQTQGIPDPTTAVRTPAQPVIQPVQTGPTKAELGSSLVDAKFNATLRALKARLEASRVSSQAETAALAQPFRQAEAGIRTRDTMARAGTEKFLSGRNLGDAGAVGQSDTSQSVITQGATSALNEQEITLKADIQRRLAEAEVLFANGELDAAELANASKMQLQLEALDKKELDAEADSVRNRQEFISTINRFAQDFTAQINLVQNDGDPSNDWQIPLLESAKQNKIDTQGLDPATGQPLARDTTPDLTSSSAIDLWEQTGVANEAISRALGIPVGTQYTRRTTGGSGGAAGLTDTGIRFKLTNGLPLNAAEAAKYGVEEGFILPQDESEDTAQEDADAVTDAELLEFIQEKGGDTKQSVIEYLINNDGRYSIEKGFAIMDAYGLSPIDLQRVQNVNPSIGQ